MSALATSTVSARMAVNDPRVRTREGLTAGSAVSEKACALTTAHQDRIRMVRLDLEAPGIRTILTPNSPRGSGLKDEFACLANAKAFVFDPTSHHRLVDRERRHIGAPALRESILQQLPKATLSR